MSVIKIHTAIYSYLARLLLVLVSGILPVQAATVVEMDTSKGVIRIELYPDKAPLTVANFLRYAEAGFYDGVIFHRVIEDWIIQAGGYDRNFVEKEVLDPVANEAGNRLKNLRGTIAMARTYEPDSADSQFFINLRDNPMLDHRAKTAEGYGYCVFGKVIKGMNVADAIGKVRTRSTGMFDDVPVEPVIINSIKLLAEAGTP